MPGRHPAHNAQRITRSAFGARQMVQTTRNYITKIVYPLTPSTSEQRRQRPRTKRTRNTIAYSLASAITTLLLLLFGTSTRGCLVKDVN